MADPSSEVSVMALAIVAVGLDDVGGGWRLEEAGQGVHRGDALALDEHHRVLADRAVVAGRHQPVRAADQTALVEQPVVLCVELLVAVIGE